MTGQLVETNDMGVLQPLTGELIPVSDVPRLANAIVEIREYRDRLGLALDALTAAIVEESTRRGTRTFAAQGMKVEISSATALDWDFDELEKLRDAGLPADRFQELVQTIVTYKVDARVAKQLEAANETYAEIIERARVRTPKKQYATVKPA